MINLAQQWVLNSGKSLEGTRDEYDGSCIDFAGDFVDSITNGRLVYFDEIINCPTWRYHAAVEIDGMIHDLWIDDVMSTEAFLEMLGGGTISYPCEEMTNK
jgi:hypothetical protein